MCVAHSPPASRRRRDSLPVRTTTPTTTTMNRQNRQKQRQPLIIGNSRAHGIVECECSWATHKLKLEHAQTQTHIEVPFNFIATKRSQFSYHQI